MSKDKLQMHSISLFSEVPDEVISRLESRGWEVRGDPDTPIYLSDDSANLVYVLIEGRVRIYYPASDEKNITLDFLEPGELFGELALVDFEARGETASTIEESRLIVFPGGFFRGVMEECTELFSTIFDYVSRRRWKIQNRLKTLVYEEARKRVAYVLLDLAGGHGLKGHRPQNTSLELTHQDLADMSGLARPTTTKILNQLEDDGLLELGTSGLELKKPLELKNIISVEE